MSALPIIVNDRRKIGSDASDCNQLNISAMSRSVAILTVSDRAASGTIKDESGPAVSEEVTRGGGWTVVQTRTVPDDVAKIQDAIRSWTNDPATAVGLILTTGGTGFGVKDVTPEVGSAVV
jgi:gephyrin